MRGLEEIVSINENPAAYQRSREPQYGTTSREDTRASDAILSFSDTFLKFWEKLNRQREWDGKPEALYREARDAFKGSPTPNGALAFIDKQWDGLRAVPAEPVPVNYNGGPFYHGEYRTVTEDGTRWHKVVNLGTGQPVIFGTPEAAIKAAIFGTPEAFARRAG